MTRAGAPLVLFCAAAGPRRGFGHLVRCGVLADALGVRRELVLRGSVSTVHAAVRLGWTVHEAGSGRLMSRLAPDLVVVDDPSRRHVAACVRQARQRGIPAATIHDLGLSRVASDLAIDGSVARPRGIRPADLEGPEFAVLGSAIAALRARPPARARRRVLIALGGGASARLMGVQVARRLSRDIADASIVVAGGLDASPVRPKLPVRCSWLDAPNGLAHALATATVAIVAGGITLYEAAALGTPAIALPIVTGQRAPVRAFAAAGAALDATGATRPEAIARAITHARSLLDNPSTASLLSRRARKLVHGHGAARVARRLLELVNTPPDEVRHAA